MVNAFLLRLLLRVISHKVDSDLIAECQALMDIAQLDLVRAIAGWNPALLPGACQDDDRILQPLIEELGAYCLEHNIPLGKEAKA